MPCVLCDQVPGAPDHRMDGSWRIVCPICGREAIGPFEADVRLQWAHINARPRPSLSASLELLDAIESAMCDLEAIRTVPGAAWQRWADDLKELRRIVEEAEEGGS